MGDKENCFIIMPITTPDSMANGYRDGKIHFSHVLECLFMPSVEKAGYNAIPPTAKGSDLIHAEIINNLETAELVLCDMSVLNPNVFFEFGIRTALNKPVCVVKDDQTDNVPFDTAVLNYHEYKSSLEPWELQSEIDKLADHIKAAAKGSKNQNQLWKYFGLKTSATAYAVEQGEDNKIDYLTMQVESLGRKIEDFSSTRREDLFSEEEIANREHTQIRELIKVYQPMNVRIRRIVYKPKHVELTYKGEWMDDNKVDLDHLMREKFSRSVVFIRIEKD